MSSPHRHEKSSLQISLRGGAAGWFKSPMSHVSHNPHQIEKRNGITVSDYCIKIIFMHAKRNYFSINFVEMSVFWIDLSSGQTIWCCVFSLTIYSFPIFSCCNRAYYLNYVLNNFWKDISNGSKIKAEYVSIMCMTEPRRES